MNDQVTKENKNKKMILDFIKKNPGNSYQYIVNYFDKKNKFSRVTVYKIIKKLSEDKLITINDNRDNRQTKSIFVNNESFLYQTMEEISSLSNAFNLILYSLNKTLSEINYNLYNSKSFSVDDFDLEQDKKITIAVYALRFLPDIFNILQQLYNYKILIEGKEKKIDEIVEQKVLDFFHSKFSKILLEIGDAYRMLLNICSRHYKSDKKLYERLMTDLRGYLFSNCFIYFDVVARMEAYNFLQACETYSLEQEVSIIFDFIWDKLFNQTETKHWREMFYDYESTSNKYILKNYNKIE